MRLPRQSKESIFVKGMTFSPYGKIYMLVGGGIRIGSLCQLQWENKCHFLVKEIEICFIKKYDKTNDIFKIKFNNEERPKHDS